MTLQEQWIGVARESPYVPLPSSVVGTVTGEGASSAVLWAALRIVTERIGGPWVHEMPNADLRLPEWTLSVADDVQSIVARGPAGVSAESEAAASRALASVRVDGLRDVPFRLHGGSSCTGHVTQ